MRMDESKGKKIGKAHTNIIYYPDLLEIRLSSFFSSLLDSTFFMVSSFWFDAFFFF